MNQSEPAKLDDDFPRNLVAFALLPVIVIGWLLVFAVWCPFVLVIIFIHERMFRRQLNSKGRYITLSRLRPRLEAGEGTLIEEMGVKGPCHFWWTCENVMARGTPPTFDDFCDIIEGADHAFNAQCVKDYLDPETGRAILTNIRPRVSRNGGLERLYPGVPVIMLVPTGKPSGVKIAALLPVPPGGGEGETAIRIANSTDRSVDLQGWRLRNRKTGDELSLSGKVPARGSVVISLAGSKLSFNVDGGLMRLITAEGLVSHRVRYTEE